MVSIYDWVQFDVDPVSGDLKCGFSSNDCFTRDTDLDIVGLLDYGIDYVISGGKKSENLYSSMSTVTLLKYYSIAS